MSDSGMPPRTLSPNISTGFRCKRCETKASPLVRFDTVCNTIDTKLASSWASRKSTPGYPRQR